MVKKNFSEKLLMRIIQKWKILTKKICCRLKFRQKNNGRPHEATVILFIKVEFYF